MKAKYLLFYAIFILSTISCQAHMFIKAALLAPVVYTGYELYQAGGDCKKATRSMRKTKDSQINQLINHIEQNCDNSYCTEIIKLLKQAQSTPSQHIEDTMQEAIEAAKQTELYKNSEKAISEGYKTAKNNLDEWAKPKK